MGHSRRYRPNSHNVGKSGSEQRSSGSSEPEFLIVGHIVRPHGVRGDVAMKVLSGYPERLLDREVFFVGPEFTAYTVSQIRPHSDGMLIRFEGILDRNAAELLRNLMVYIRLEDAIPLEEGEVYAYQIEGINVITDDGIPLGKLTDFIETGANDVYVVTTPDGKEILIPAIPEVILSIDIENDVMTVRLMDGLVD